MLKIIIWVHIIYKLQIYLQQNYFKKIYRYMHIYKI